jgi:hypothetical protein
MLEIPAIEQHRTNKPAGYGLAGIPYVKHNRKHWQDAVAHAAFYLMGKGLQGPPVATPWPPETKPKGVKVVRRSRF